MASISAKLYRMTLPLLGACSGGFLFDAGLSSQALTPPAYDKEPIASSDSGIDGPPYQQIYLALGELASRFTGYATVIDYGTTPGGRSLRLIKIEKLSTSPLKARGDAKPGDLRRPAVIISGSTHGNEYLGIEDRLPAWFLEHRHKAQGLRRFLDAGGVLFVVPILNPDGYDRDSRHNNNNVDLNRDFEIPNTTESGFREPETRLLAAYLEQELWSHNLKLRLAVDYHCCNGALLYPWSHTTASLPAEALAAHAAIGRLMHEDIDATYRQGPTGQVLGYLPRGTSKDYYYAKYGALAFTYEGTHGTEASKFARHTVWWNHILELVADTDGSAL